MHTFSRLSIFTWFVGMLLALPLQSLSQNNVITGKMISLRRGAIPEWSTFPKKVDKELLLSFDAQPNTTPYTLSLKQEDVKQKWRVLLNGKELAKLHQDENPMISYWPVPTKRLQQGKNSLQIIQADTLVDDIRVGEIKLHAMSTEDLLSQATIDITVTDQQTGNLLPSRITITTTDGTLQTVGTASNYHLAIRPGMIYTAHGKASFGLPAGKYTLYATRGFEYGVDSIQVTVKKGEVLEKRLVISREVPTPGWISADSHIHTYTYSRHGDASLAERAITLAGEGIELPVLTDHNVHVTIDSTAIALNVRKYFTPVTGNEVTTEVGHFNIFPTSPTQPPVNHQVENWQMLAKNLSIHQPGKKPIPQVIILNHARDVHHQFRPFGEDRHIAAAGMNKDGWQLPANAMEIINSGSQQTDQTQLFHDWLGMLNRGCFLTPMGASDSHDVGRYLVGQARTYIKCEDNDPGNIHVTEVVTNLLEGKVMVSFGLMAEVKAKQVNTFAQQAGVGKEVEVEVTVLGPSWVRANKVTLYANGYKIKEEIIEDQGKKGIKWTKTWKIPVSGQDIQLVALAQGPGNYRPFWPIAKPYQPVSSEWKPGVMGCSGAVWIDGDGDGKRTSAYHYAQKLVADANGDMKKLVNQLSSYDAAVALQAASVLQAQGIALTDSTLTQALAKAPETVQAVFRQFGQAWQLSEQKRKRTYSDIPKK
ncbi:CehA/McbA family metallohydrolase [Rhodocytophaga aerolata]|uniref:CehA/McbA family metallohydrolase n=1 Tax=Rhodocytophaga aerolata TaxID=455078 RepID=A0ABT8RBF7_9BACT|nr:CehA/McbA family metallohydrolase [Rhodocytophaga aerolata]MDO1449436.1 CehA/McbA family metallohydrolase [Rhodocytophaga aerolata]